MRNINKMEIRINSYIPVTNVEGVGSRFAIWVQGCPIKCEGCANSNMWDFNGGFLYKVSEILKLIKFHINKIEGITFLGGEPLAQIKAVTEICKNVKELGLSVIVFTGYEYEDLKEKDDFKILSKYVDVLIDGRFDKNKIDYSRAWVGSSNQNYYFFTDRYNKSIISSYKNKLEMRIRPDNRVIITGMGNFEKLTEVMEY